jgi:DUF1365 family protein
LHLRRCCSAPRFAVRGHTFRYRLALAYIDLDELPRLLHGRLVAPSPGLIRFRRRDYLADSNDPLADAVRDLVEQRTGRRPAGPVRLLTQLRSFGHCFNPVSFYYCFDHSGMRLEHVLAEVTNTPWGDRHVYVLSAAEPSVALAGSSAKQLHVSPFMSRHGTSAASTGCERNSPRLGFRSSASGVRSRPTRAAAAAATSAPTTTSATSCSRGCSTRR